MATNDETVRSLARLDGNQDFEKVLGHLQRQYESAVETGAVASELIHIGRAQGQQQVLRDFLKLARDARKIAQARG